MKNPTEEQIAKMREIEGEAWKLAPKLSALFNGAGIENGSETWLAMMILVGRAIGAAAVEGGYSSEAMLGGASHLAGTMISVAMATLDKENDEADEAAEDVVHYAPTVRLH